MTTENIAATVNMNGAEIYYEMEGAVEMFRAIPRSALWIVPNGGHGPIFFDAALQFVQAALAFFRVRGAAG